MQRSPPYTPYWYKFKIRFTGEKILQTERKHTQGSGFSSHRELDQIDRQHYWMPHKNVLIDDYPVSITLFLCKRKEGTSHLIDFLLTKENPKQILGVALVKCV